MDVDSAAEPGHVQEHTAATAAAEPAESGVGTGGTAPGGRPKMQEVVLVGAGVVGNLGIVLQRAEAVAAQHAVCAPMMLAFEQQHVGE